MDGRHRGGGDAARARATWNLTSRSRRCSPALPGDMAGRTAAETHGSALELATEPHADVAGAAARAARACAAGSPSVLEPLGMRAAVAGTHPFTLWEDVEVSPGARYQFLYSSMRELARREPTFGLHVHVAVPDPELAVRALQRHARAPADAARAVGQLAVLAGPRHGARVDAHAAVPGLPARRDPAPVPLLRRLRRGHRPAAALRRLPRADVPVVGRATAAALRHARGARHGRADAPRRHRRDRRARAVPGAARGARGVGRATRSSTARRCSRRTASSPRATAWRRSLHRPGDASDGGRRASGSSSCSTRCAPHAADLGCERRARIVRVLADATGAVRQRSRAGRGSAPQLGRLMRALHADFTTARAKPAVLAL